MCTNNIFLDTSVRCIPNSRGTVCSLFPNCGFGFDDSDAYCLAVLNDPSERSLRQAGMWKQDRVLAIGQHVRRQPFADCRIEFLRRTKGESSRPIIRSKMTALDPSPVVHYRQIECLLPPKVAIPLLGSRIGPGYDRIWVVSFRSYSRLRALALRPHFGHESDGRHPPRAVVENAPQQRSIYAPSDRSVAVHCSWPVMARTSVYDLRKTQTCQAERVGRNAMEEDGHAVSEAEVGNSAQALLVR